MGQTPPSCRGTDACPVRTTEGRKQPQSLGTTCSPAKKWAHLRPVLEAHVGVPAARKQLLTWPRAPPSPSSLWITWTALLVFAPPVRHPALESVPVFRSYLTQGKVRDSFRNARRTGFLK